MRTSRRSSRKVGLAAFAALGCTVGCTMCPDPYDYSGPVPNGSPPQNEFRARSNGILPLGAAPRPFPPVVQRAPGDEPGPAAIEPPVGDPADDAVRPVSAEVVEAETTASGG